MYRKLVLIFLLIVTLLWLSFIFSNSLDNSEQSAQKSSTVTEVVNQVASNVGIKEEIPHSAVRDMAHFAEFAVLACLICADLAVAFYKNFSTKPWLYAICPAACMLLCFALACVDELLQKMSDGRASQFSDVLLDSLGALSGVAAFAVCYALTVCIIRKIKKKD